MHIHYIPGLGSVDCLQHSRPVTQKVFLWNYVILWRLLSYNWNRCGVIIWYKLFLFGNGTPPLSMYIYICIHNRSDVTWASWRLKSPTPQLFVYQGCVLILWLVWVVIDQVIDRPTDWLNVDVAWPLLAQNKIRWDAIRSDQIKQIR